MAIKVTVVPKDYRSVTLCSHHELPARLVVESTVELNTRSKIIVCCDTCLTLRTCTLQTPLEFFGHPELTRLLLESGVRRDQDDRVEVNLVQFAG